jgi:hypothetical protein
MVLAVIFLNFADGDRVADLERLENDSFAAILRAIERDLLSRGERRSLKPHWETPLGNPAGKPRWETPLAADPRTGGSLAFGAVWLAGADQ